MVNYLVLIYSGIMINSIDTSYFFSLINFISLGLYLKTR
nr:MAG TPA: hypothetical protein [Caudoviricetes sp.]